MSAAPAVAPKAAIRSPSGDHRPDQSRPSRSPTGALPRSAARHPPHAAPHHLLHRQTVALDVHLLARARHPAEFREHQSADGAHVLPGEAVAEHALQLGERHAALHPQLLAGRPPIGATSSVSYSSWISPTICSRMSSSVTMPGGAAELIHHHREMAGAPLEVAQLAVEGLAFGNVRWPDGSAGSTARPSPVPARMSLA